MENSYQEAFEWIQFSKGRVRYAGCSKGRDEPPNLGMAGGAALGSSAGVPLGAPGMVIGGIAGGVGGAVAGEKMADAVDRARIYSQR
ncbi:MAG: hypothetical protein EON54_19260, partial [Alcaligenaceae bacterium]